MSVQRFPKPTHQARVAILVPHSSFTPTPTMSELEIAYFKGVEARRLNRPDSDNPHTEKLAPNSGALAETWMKGYEGR